MRGVVNCFMINNENNFKNDRNFCDGVGEISEGDGCKVDEELIKEKFDEFGNLLRDHDGRLKSLEISWALQSESLANVKQGQEDIKKTMDKIEGQMLTNHNAMLTGLNSLIINKNDNIVKMELSRNEKEGKVETAKIENKSKIYIQLFVFLGSLATVISGMYIAMK